MLLQPHRQDGQRLARCRRKGKPSAHCLIDQPQAPATVMLCLCSNGSLGLSLCSQIDPIWSLVAWHACNRQVYVEAHTRTIIMKGCSLHRMHRKRLYRTTVKNLGRRRMKGVKLKTMKLWGRNEELRAAQIDAVAHKHVWR